MKHSVLFLCFLFSAGAAGAQQYELLLKGGT